MENTNTEKSLFDLSYDENLKQSIKSAAGVAGVAAFLSLAGAVLGVIAYFIQRQKIARIESAYGDLGVRQASMAGGIVSIVIGLAISLLLFAFLSKFARNVKSGINSNNNMMINEGLGGLSSYFKTAGIIIIIVIAIMILAIAAGLGRGM